VLFTSVLGAQSPLPVKAVTASMQVRMQVVEGQRLEMRALGAPILVERGLDYNEYEMQVVVRANVSWSIRRELPRPADGVAERAPRQEVVARGDGSRELSIRWRASSDAAAPSWPRLALQADGELLIAPSLASSLARGDAP